MRAKGWAIASLPIYDMFIALYKYHDHSSYSPVIASSLQVVRCFSDSKIAHVDDPVNIDPVSEFEAISVRLRHSNEFSSKAFICQDELLIADIEMVTRKMPSLRKRACAEPEAKKVG